MCFCSIGFALNIKLFRRLVSTAHGDILLAFKYTEKSILNIDFDRILDEESRQENGKTRTFIIFIPK